jgi:hypothetical protein
VGTRVDENNKLVANVSEVAHNGRDVFAVGRFPSASDDVDSTEWLGTIDKLVLIRCVV